MLLPSKLPAFSDCLEFVNMDYVFFSFFYLGLIVYCRLHATDLHTGYWCLCSS
jgi:hypothetical protein